LKAPARRLRRLLRADLHDQPAAPLPPPPRQRLAARPSAHPGAESVGVLSLSVPWSVCRFHEERSWREPPASCRPLCTGRQTNAGRARNLPEIRAGRQPRRAVPHAREHRRPGAQARHWRL